MKRIVVSVAQGTAKNALLSTGVPPALPEPATRVLIPDDPEEKRQYVKLINRYGEGRFFLDRDVLAQEEEIDILLADSEGYTLSRTPGDDHNLIVGSLYTRARIGCLADLCEVRFQDICGRNQAEVFLSSEAGQQKLDLRPLQDTRRERLYVRSLFEFQEKFEELQVVRRQTGATHGAALFTVNGEILSFGEDVGRHNALDKAIGHALEHGTLARSSVAVLSSRLALELVLKAVACSIPILAGFSVATASAVECAQACGVTLIGRLRPGTLNVYSHCWRVV